MVYQSGVGLPWRPSSQPTRYDATSCAIREAGPRYPDSRLATFAHRARFSREMSRDWIERGRAVCQAPDWRGIVEDWWTPPAISTSVRNLQGSTWGCSCTLRCSKSKVVLVCLDHAVVGMLFRCSTVQYKKERGTMRLLCQDAVPVRNLDSLLGF